MQTTGNSIVTALNKSLDSNDMDAVGKLWLQVCTNVKQSEHMKLMLSKNIEKQVKYKRDNDILQEKYQRLVEEAEGIKAASRDISTTIDSEFTTCHESIRRIRAEREELQGKYSENVAELSNRLEDALTIRQKVDEEKNSLIDQVSSLLNTIAATDKSYEKQLQQYNGLDDRISKIESETVTSRECHEMNKADLESQKVVLREIESRLKDELGKYSSIFDNVFTTLSQNKERSTQQQVVLDNLNSRVKALIKFRDQTQKKHFNLKKNISVADDRLLELQQSITKSNEQVARYDGLIAAFEDQIEDLSKRV